MTNKNHKNLGQNFSTLIVLAFSGSTTYDLFSTKAIKYYVSVPLAKPKANREESLEIRFETVGQIIYSQSIYHCEL